MGMFSRRKTEDRVIDLRDVAEAPTVPQWGSPVPCPSCSGRGYLDHIDPYREIMYLHCTECANKYELSRVQMDNQSV